MGSQVGSVFNGLLMEIRDIEISDLDIPEIRTWIAEPPVIPVTPPVVTGIGVPIINMPGCVEHMNRIPVKNVVVFFQKMTLKVSRLSGDAGVPSFNPIQYEPDQMIFTGEAEVPPYKPPEPEVPETPEVSAPVIPKEEVFVCPTREQELKNPVGKILEGNKKIVRYEQVGKECLMVTEKLTIPDQIIGNIPNAGMVTTTASIAVVATTSALLAKPVADLLLKVVSSTKKKVLKKIASSFVGRECEERDA